MNTFLHKWILLTFGGGLLMAAVSVAQPAPPPLPVTQPAPPPPAIGSQGPNVPAAPVPPSGGSFQERVRAMNRAASGPSDNKDVPEKTFTTNYQIKVEYLAAGKPASFSIVTAQTKFTYNAIMKDNLFEDMTIPGMLTFEAQLSNETEDSIFLGYFLGRSVPYSTGAKYGPKAAPGNTYTSIQQVQTGIKNGATFHFGKPLKTVESDGEAITITVSKLKGQ